MLGKYDAGCEREALAEELASWEAAGMVLSYKAQRWDRRVSHLARVCRMARQMVMADLQNDAKAILAME